MPWGLDVSSLQQLLYLGIEGYGSHGQQQQPGTRLPASLKVVDFHESLIISMPEIVAAGDYSRYGNPVERLTASAVECIQLELQLWRSPSGELQADGLPAVPVGFRTVSLTAPEIEVHVRQSGRAGRPCRSVAAMLGRLLDCGVPEVCKRLTIGKRSDKTVKLIGTWSDGGEEFYHEYEYLTLTQLAEDVSEHTMLPARVSLGERAGVEALVIDFA